MYFIYLYIKYIYILKCKPFIFNLRKQVWTWQSTVPITTPSISLYKPLVGNSRAAAS